MASPEITVGSVCSGIAAEAVAWRGLPFRHSFFAEIEKFPSAVLAHHYPETPNVGDMLAIEAKDHDPIDLLFGGTPCQSFSVAGRRGGLDDPRGDLALQFCRLARDLRARWIVWENVPGVLSSNGGRDFGAILDAFEEIGFILDIDILDAQFHGLPQRRRRVFVCGQHRDHLIARKTTSSALTIAQFWQETLLGILIDRCPEFASALASSACRSLSKDGALRRMKLFGLHGGNECNYKKLRDNLIAEFLKQAHAPKRSDYHPGGRGGGRTRGGQSMDSETALQYILTEQSLSAALGESYEVMKSFITSTTTKTITQREIYSCSIAALLIGKLIARSSQSCPPLWSAASSSSIAIEGFINYARSASRDLFTGMEWVHAWSYFIRKARRTSAALKRVRVERCGEILPDRSSLSRNPPPRREARESVAALTANGVGTRGADDNQGQAGHLIAFSAKDHGADASTVSPTLRAMGHGASHANGGGQIAVALTDRQGKGPDSDASNLVVAHTLRADGFDASEDGTGRGTPIVPVAFQANASHHNTMRVAETAPTLDKCKADGMSTFDGLAVRRITPREAERLQGFPDDYTLIPYRGKPACDGPRYKALGNSMAVPVVRWIGERIAQVEALT